MLYDKLKELQHGDNQLTSNQGNKMKLKEFTPADVVAWIKARPGCIQSACYPNPGEPVINESLYFDHFKV